MLLLPSIFARGKCYVVDPTTHFQRLHEFGSLALRWLQAILKGFHMRSTAAYSNINLVFNVFLQDCHWRTSSSSDEIRMRPRGNSWRSKRALRPLTNFTKLWTPNCRSIRKAYEPGLAHLHRTQVQVLLPVPSLPCSILLRLDRWLLSIVYPRHSWILCTDTSDKKTTWHLQDANRRTWRCFYSPYVLLYSRVPSHIQISGLRLHPSQVRWAERVLHIQSIWLSVLLTGKGRKPNISSV